MTNAVSRYRKRPMSRNVWTSWSGSTGLTRCFVKPASVEREMSASLPHPDRAINTESPVAWQRPEFVGDVVPVHPRQANVQQDHVRRPCSRGPRSAVRGDRPPPSGLHVPPCAGPARASQGHHGGHRRSSIRNRRLRGFATASLSAVWATGADATGGCADEYWHMAPALIEKEIAGQNPSQGVEQEAQSGE
ncbi:hypothetical protein B0G74_8993 [Paraburkholderia sp. BL9I2N2]|nr:hypothetical protein B0G74_8993 [Paraburkholderia sp. BL9I2N2]